MQMVILILVTYRGLTNLEVYSLLVESNLFIVSSMADHATATDRFETNHMHTKVSRVNVLQFNYQNVVCSISFINCKHN